MKVENNSAVVSLSSGVARGDVNKGICVFRGLPYGERANPRGRLSEVVSPTPWPGERDATQLAAVFPQTPSRLAAVMGNGIDRNAQSEDAFVLNVWAPQEATALPVFVFIHGGGFLSGGGSAFWYDGERLSREGRIVVVTVNYRLGALGHFTSGKDSGGNRAVHDLIRALEWVQENIGQFGGDASNVTVGGQSAGAWYAWLLGVSPASKGLLRRNVMLSLPTVPAHLVGESIQTSQEFLALAGASDLDGMSVEEILVTQDKLMSARARFGDISVGFRPVVEEGLVPDWLFDFPRAVEAAHVSSSMLGSTAEENTAFMFAVPEVVGVDDGQVRTWFEQKLGVAGERAYASFAAARPGHSPYTQLIDASSYSVFGAGVGRIAMACNGAGIPVYPYRFSVSSHVHNLMSPHCLELPFLFGNREAWSDAPMVADVADSVFESVGADFRSAISSFATTCQPVSPSLGIWQQFDSATPEIHDFNDDGIARKTWKPLLDVF